MYVDGKPRRKLLHQSIQDEVKQYIIDREYKAGDPLPPEADLARELGISRPSLREAIRVLQTLGVVETRHGTGTFVGHFSLTPLVDGLVFNIRIRDHESAAQIIRELLQIREILECSLVVEVARDISPETIEELDTLVQRMGERAARQEQFSEEDRMFHHALYHQMGNPLIVQLIHAFWDVFDQLRDDLPGIIGDLSNIVQSHQRIVDALRQRDGAAAATAMTEHFEDIRSRVRQY